MVQRMNYTSVKNLFYKQSINSIYKNRIRDISKASSEHLIGIESMLQNQPEMSKKWVFGYIILISSKVKCFLSYFLNVLSFYVIFYRFCFAFDASKAFVEDPKDPSIVYL